MCKNCHDPNKRRDWLRDHGSGGWDEARWPKPATKKKHKRTPCPQNDGGPHVYIWVPEPYNIWFPERKEEIKVCCGCGKLAPQGRKPKRRWSWHRKLSKNRRPMNDTG